MAQSTSHAHLHSHDDHAACAHDHGIHTKRPSVTRALQIALGLTLALMVAEVVGGLMSNSLALLADAGHMLTDAGALALSLFVAWMCRQPSRPEKTYGYLRWEILAALLNGATLLLISFWIVWEAVRRFQAPQPVAGGVMLAFAVVGLIVNLIAVRILHGVHGESLNVRGAYLHVLGDMLASGGTVVAAVLVRLTGWLPADPISSLISTVLIIGSAWRLVREAVDVLLE